MKIQEITSLDDLKDIPKLQRPIQEFKAKQERIGQPASLQEFLLEYMKEVKRK